IMQTCYKCVPYTTCVKRCVDHGHWECKWVPCCDNGGWRRFFRGHHHGCGNDCCNTCDSCNSCNSCNSGCNDCCNNCCCIPMKQVKCWVSCPTTEEVPVTCYKRVCECKPVCIKVCSCKTVVKEVPCQVCCYKCVPCTKTCTYCV